MKVIYHPLLMAIYPVLFFYTANRDELGMGVIWEPMVLTVGLGLGVWLIAQLIYRNGQKSSLATTFFLLWFFSYGHVANLLGKIYIPLGRVTIGPDKILFPIFLIIIFLAFRKIKKSEVAWPINLRLNIITALLVVSQIAQFAPKSAAVRITDSQIEAKQVGATPDIYFIILDSYAEEQVLKEMFGYDNSGFVKSLRDKGFVVVDGAKSNYAHTFLSLSATMNMQYVNHLIKEMGIEGNDASVMEAMIRDNQVVRDLKNSGYKIINFASGWGPTERLELADVNYDEGKLFQIAGKKISISEFNLVFLQTTIVAPLVRDTLMDQARSKVLFALNKLGEIPYEKGKKFVMAHFNVPHPPYLFDEEGKPIPDQALEMVGDSFNDQKNYLKQLTYISKRIEDTIDKIIARSEQPPIIILQSDHGPATSMGNPYAWPRPAPIVGISERMHILNAYYFPSMPDPPIIKTPVNTFRVVFNSYFGQNYELLEDKNYFTDYKRFYEFFDVTKKLK